MFEKIKNEPTIFLFRKMWRFSEGNHGKVVLFISLLTLSNLVGLTEPLVLAKLLNEIQTNGINSENINFLMYLSMSFIVINFSFWILLSIARILETNNSFLVRKKYKEHLLNKVLNFNLSWHTNKDSGDIIDKVNKSSLNLYNFSDGTFRVIHIIIQITVPIIAIIFFNWKVGIFTLLGIIITFFILTQFDKKIIPQYKKLNEYENKIEAKIFDSISNITSIAILNIKNNILKNISKSLLKPFGIYKKKNRLMESKWFTVALLFKSDTTVKDGGLMSRVPSNGIDLLHHLCVNC